MLCAVYSSPQETSKYSILWSDDGNRKLEKGAKTKWQLRKVERSPQRKRVVPRRRAPRRPPRRDSSNQQGTATFHWRTSTSEASKAFQEERRISSETRRSFCFVPHLISVKRLPRYNQSRQRICREREHALVGRPLL